MVSSLFNHQPSQVQIQNQEQLLTRPSVPSINKNLVASEPLIRSSSWQNKTLIDLNRQPQHQQQQVLPLPSQMNHLDTSSAISNHQKTLPTAPYNQQSTLTRHPLSHGTLCGPMRNDNNISGIELAKFESNKETHYYCGVNTLRNSQQQQHNNNLHYAIDYQNPPMLENLQPNQYNLNPTNTLNQSFQTLINEQKYPINSFVYPGNDYVNNIGSQIISSKLNPTTGRTVISGSSSDSTLNARFDSNRKSNKRSRGQVSPVCCNLLKSTKLCFLVFLLLASACFLLVALLSNYNPTDVGLNHNNELTAVTTTTTAVVTSPTPTIDKGKSCLLDYT